MNKHITLRAPRISCQHCAMHIKRGLADIPGLRHVDVDLISKTVSLEYDTDETLKRAQAALDEIGYPATPVQA